MSRDCRKASGLVPPAVIATVAVMFMGAPVPSAGARIWPTIAISVRSRVVYGRLNNRFGRRDWSLSGQKYSGDDNNGCEKDDSNDGGS